MRYISLCLFSALLLTSVTSVHADTASCSVAYSLPADIPTSTSDATES